MNLRISVLDAATTVCSDVDFKSLSQYGQLSVYDRFLEDLIDEDVYESEIILVNKVLVTRSFVAKFPKLRYIIVTATGFNNIDLKATSEAGIKVSNTRDYSSKAVAQFCFALILKKMHEIDMHHNSILKGEWQLRGDFSYDLSRQILLEGKTIGIIGLGKIGRQVSLLSRAFGMKVLTNYRGEKSSEVNLEYADKELDLKELASRSDIVTLHCPLNDQTKNMIDHDFIMSMKKNSLLINTARAGLVNTDALISAIKRSQITAALDVFEKEPIDSNSELLNLPGLTLTPHMAWRSVETRALLVKKCCECLKAYFKGSPINLV